MSEREKQGGEEGENSKEAGHLVQRLEDGRILETITSPDDPEKVKIKIIRSPEGKIVEYWNWEKLISFAKEYLKYPGRGFENEFLTDKEGKIKGIALIREETQEIAHYARFAPALPENEKEKFIVEAAIKRLEAVYPFKKSRAQ